MKKLSHTGKLHMLVALVLSALLFTCACSVITGATVTEEKAFGDAQRAYRNASLVVRGECLRSHTDEDGAQCYDLSVNEVLAGKADKGQLIHCVNGAMKQGEEYLLYLAADTEAVYHTEDAQGYTLLTSAPLAVGENGVSFEGATLSLEDIKNSIAQQNSIVSAPAESLFYRDIASLTDACAQIFIGRVKTAPELSQTPFRTVSEGATVENTLDASLVTLEVYGVIKGELKYGDTVQLVNCPALCDEVTDAATLKSVRCDARDAAMPNAGDVYMFFLVNSPDAKQELYFSVNPLQGLVKLDVNDRLSFSSLNAALAGQYNLESLVGEIKAALKS